MRRHKNFTHIIKNSSLGKKRFWALALCFFTHLGFASDFDYKIKVFICADKSITINDIQKKQYANKFCDSRQCNFGTDNTQCVNWAYIEIKNYKLDAYVINSVMFYHHVTAYFFSEDMQFLDSTTTGYNVYNKLKLINTPSNPINVPVRKQLKCYIKFQTAIGTGIDFSIYKNTDFINLVAKQHTFNGIVNGIFFLAIIYSALFSLLLWRRIYVYYMLYVFSFWVFMLSINAETSLYLSWLNIPFGFGFYIIPHSILTISLILYTRELLQLEKKLPVFSKITIVIVFILILLLLIYFITGYIGRDNIINKIALVPSYIASIILILRKDKSAWFVFSGISLIFIAFLNLEFDLELYIPVFFTFSVYGIIEIILFGVSISYWLKTLVSENAKALQLAILSAEEINKIRENHNSILEQEVAIKTKELKLANQQLGVYIKQVENLNQYLETDNDKLKIKVIDQIKARSDDKIMNFEDFKLNFPDEESCYAYIENIKWANGFICYKCANTKYSERKLANTIPARRCTKCGFVNTLTSYTLYHNIKFPLQKAFYITYMIGTNKSKKLEELTKELDLRTGTIHGFLKKVKEANIAFKTKRKNKDGWTHLIGYYINNNSDNTKTKEQSNPDK